jgi:AbrB family looped-hinge helix DNA binding protein
MPLVKITRNFQITIPQELRKGLRFAIGGYIKVEKKKDSLVLRSVKMVEPDQANKPTVARLSKEEQKILATAKKKIAKMNADLIHSVGLNNKEIKVAAKAGLIDPDQAYWWHEDWQKGEREAERDIAEGRVSKPYDNVDELIKDLKS